MKLKEHTRNQKRMYRIHKQDEKIHDLELMIGKLQQENKQLKAELKNKPDTEITLRDDKGNEFALIQSERIDMQERLNKTIERLFNNWNKLKESLKDVMNSSSGDDKNFVETILNIMQKLEQGSDNNDTSK